MSDRTRLRLKKERDAYDASLRGMASRFFKRMEEFENALFRLPAMASLGIITVISMVGLGFIVSVVIAFIAAVDHIQNKTVVLRPTEWACTNQVGDECFQYTRKLP